MNLPPSPPPQSAGSAYPAPQYPYGPAPASPRGKPFALASLITGGVGIIPLFIYMMMSISGTGPLALLFGIIGLLVHGLAFISGIVGLSMGSKTMGILAAIGNAILLLLILLFIILIFNMRY